MTDGHRYHAELERLVHEISLGEGGRPIGALQKERSMRQRLVRVPSLFDGRSIHDHYAMHVGGLAELQFNIGFESISGEEKFRHGVAFSLQPNRNMPDIRLLIPRIRKFNEFMHAYPEHYADLSMWHFVDGARSRDYPPGPIPDALLKKESFIFLGALQEATQIDTDWILDDFDRLKPLYDYVEGDELFPALTKPPRRGFVWSPGNKARAPRQTITRSVGTVEAAHRHNLLQDALYKHLESIHTLENTSGEQSNGTGKPVDVAVREGDTYTYYEIKTHRSARLCIRDALGQLLEYAYWPGAQEATKLVIVGEAPLDHEAKRYLGMMRRRFSLPIHYRHLDSKAGKLVK